MHDERRCHLVERHDRRHPLLRGTAVTQHEHQIRAHRLHRRRRARAKQLTPGSLDVLFNEALLYEDEGRYDDAVKVLSDAIGGVRS